MNTKTNANVPEPPSRQRASFIAKAPEPTMTPKNMTEKMQDMSFKVDPAFHREFKTTATMAGLSMKDLLEQAFAAWKSQNS